MENSLSHFYGVGKRVLAAEIKLRNHKEPKCQDAKSVASHFSDPEEIRPDFQSKGAMSTLLSTEELSAWGRAEIIGQDSETAYCAIPAPQRLRPTSRPRANPTEQAGHHLWQREQLRTSLMMSQRCCETNKFQCHGA